MSFSLKILNPGLLSSVQDMGRIGYRRFGVPKSGALHTELAVIANKLAGNAPQMPVIEFFLQGPTLTLQSGTARLSLSGDFNAELIRKGFKTKLRSWCSVTLKAGDSLQVGNVKSGKVGYIGVAGGLGISKTMGSYSTYMRGGFGGCDGKKLSANAVFQIPETDFSDKLDSCLAENPDDKVFAKANSSEPYIIRVVLGPQDDYFTEPEIDKFLSGNYKIGRDSDRMGSRLEGAVLSHHPDKKPEIVSDGIVPGAIQVPGNGSPIVLLADGPTVGGYPKIATVISSDLSKLAVMLPGSIIKFQAVESEEAEKILIQERKELAALLENLQPMKPVGVIDLEALYGTNLICGVINALSEIPDEDYISKYSKVVKP
ncbi:MAG: hypothetical protein C0602_06250 [Denitrovibrio sp.]|nr:MAG: hypothetical protein C0602_06250 [Denitrovibrio sp.]